VFGYEKGAFTGALARKAGLAETANGGTLFLDEIGDVPLGMQVKLLRLIESGTYRRVGGVETLRSDFRLVAATHKPLARMVAEGQFRQDLYYRIAAFPLQLPSLRERHGDIGLLAESLLQRGGSGVRLAPDALAALDAYHWPGNIRELRNVIERARLFADDGEIRPPTSAWAKRLPLQLRPCWTRPVLSLLCKVCGPQGAGGRAGLQRAHAVPPPQGGGAGLAGRAACKQSTL
jgi:transcriptional regulator with PAS, ATPase and Fis domain